MSRIFANVFSKNCPEVTANFTPNIIQNYRKFYSKLMQQKVLNFIGFCHWCHSMLYLWLHMVPLHPWTKLNQWKYGPNICCVEGRCETGLCMVETGIHASSVWTEEEKRMLFFCLMCDIRLDVVQYYQILGLHFNTCFVQASSVQGNHI